MKKNDKIINYSSKLGFNDITFSFAYGEENIHFMFHRKLIPLEEYKNSTKNDENQYLYKKGDNTEYGNDFVNCTMILDKITIV